MVFFVWSAWDASSDARQLAPKSEDAAETAPWWLDKATAGHNCKLNTTQLLEAMASCTAVTYVNGELVGDPLDVSMFKSTGWILDEAVAASLGVDQVVIAYVYP